MGAVVNFHLPILLGISPCGAKEALGLNLHPGHADSFLASVAMTSHKDSCDGLGHVRGYKIYSEVQI